ncbi:hypothetical protein OIV83_000083 [Microbotryomycetes sp. JL201]|nr:hypothetical protein OIV83_000083 [Microbotryomycetes sp. JL201]
MLTAANAQIVLWSVVLAKQWNKQCDQPLRWFLALSCIRLGLQLPDLLGLFGLVLFFLGNIWYFSSETCSATANLLHKAGLAALIIAWIYAAESILLLIAIVFFLPVLLVTMRMTGYGTRHEIGPMTKEQIEQLPLGIYVGELPETSTQEHAVGEDLNVPKEIKANASVVQVETASSITASNSAADSPKAKKRRWWRLWSSAPASGKASGTVADPSLSGLVPLPAGMRPLRLSQSQASCSICLCDYEAPPLLTDPNAREWQPEPLRILPCGHAFHAPCLESWLVVSGRKPANKDAKEQDTPSPTDGSSAV